MTIVLISSSPELEGRVREATGGALLALPGAPLPADPADLFAQLAGALLPDVVVLDAAASPGQALALAGRLDREWPSLSVVLVSDLGPDLVLPAMRAGVRDILEPSSDPVHIREILDRAAEAAALRRIAATGPSAPADGPAGPSGRVLTVVSPKGGVGKTTVAVNLAVGLAAARPGSTVLVDLDVQFGDVVSALNLTPEYTLVDALRGAGSRDTLALKTFLTRHESGLYVLCGPDSPAAADAISGADVGRLVQMLASEFRYVVVDTAAGITDHTLSALDHTTDLVPVTSMDVPGVRALRTELDTLADLALAAGRRHTVLNFVDRAGGLSVADVEATLGTGIDIQVPRSTVATVAMNRGVPVLQSGVRDPMTAQLRRLVERIVPAPPRRPSRWRAKGRHRAAAAVGAS